VPPERSRPLLAALACAALLTPLGGCGDGSDEPATTSTATAPAEPTPLRRDLERELAKLISAGDAKVDPMCVIERLRDTLSNELVEAATEAAERGEEIPKEAIDAAFAAGQACAPG
jgi:hypothetical protein